MRDLVAAMGHLNIDLLYGRMPRIPAEGEEVFSESLDVALGGGPSATLVNLHRLGATTRLGTYLGTDFLSDFARRQLDAYGLPYRNLYRGAASPLTVTSIISTARDRTFVSHAYEEEGGLPGEAEVYELYRGARIAYIDHGYPDVWRRLKREGAILVLDSQWRDDLSLGLYAEAFRYIDYFTPNEKEATAITGESDPEKALAILGEALPRALIKVGGRGCLVREGGRTRLLPAHEGFGFVDATGAGDAFLAGFIFGLLEGRDFETAARLGNASGAKCVSGVGCLSAWLGRDDLLACLG